MSDLVVRISADIKQLEKGYEQAAKETEALQGRLSQIGKASGVAFAAGAAAIGLAVNAYQKAAIEDNKLRASLEATGGAAGLTFEQIKKMGDELEILTGLEGEAINASQTLLLTFDKIGKEAFPGALKAAADLSVLMGTDLKSATLQVGKALQDPIEGLSALGRVGIKFTEDQKALIKTLVDSGRQAEAQALILESLSKKVGGLAEGAAKGKDGFNLLAKTFGDFVEGIGSKFAPVLNAAAKILGNFFQVLSESKFLTGTAVAILGIGTALTGLIATVAAVGIGFLKYKALLTALTLAGNTTIVNILTMGGAFAKIPAIIGGLVTSFGALSIAIKILVGATGIGLILVVLSTLLFSWESTWKGIKDITFAAIDGIKGILGGLADILVGVFTFDGDKVAKGWEAVKTASVNAANQTIDAVKGVIDGRKDDIEIAPGTGEAGTGGLKDEEAAKTTIIDDETKKRIQIARDERAILKAEADEVSAEEIDFLKRRQELKTAGLEAEKIKNEEEKALALENIRLKNEALLLEEEDYQLRRAEFLTQVREQDAVLQEELRALSTEERAALDEEDLQALRDKILTEQDIEDQAAREKLERSIASRNDFLKNQQKFGTAYAKINQFINSEEVQGALAASNQLVALTQSKNNTLKGIGKAAAFAQNAISTAQGATSAYASLAPIPFVGPALGIAAAAALVAFGAEKASMILAANTGGIVTGGIPGIDSVPALLTPGELVVPAKNFDQVVGAVRGENQSGSSQDTALLQEISGKLDNVGGQTIINGDVLSDEVFIDRLVDKINDAVSFRNLRLNTGV